MTGRTFEAFFPRIEHSPGAQLLAIEDVTVGRVVRDVSLTVCAGAIVVLAGLVGSGRPEVRRAVLELEAIDGGAERFDDRPVDRPGVRALLDAGIVYLPPDRR